jgi:hypothetical protein
MDIKKSGNSSLRPFQFSIHNPGNPDILLLHAVKLSRFSRTAGYQ